jgi:hypothetical protein
MGKILTAIWEQDPEGNRKEKGMMTKDSFLNFTFD